eukprot:5719559-Karenia_brevis.AAC.1
MDAVASVFVFILRAATRMPVGSVSQHRCWNVWLLSARMLMADNIKSSTHRQRHLTSSMKLGLASKIVEARLTKFWNGEWLSLVSKSRHL